MVNMAYVMGMDNDNADTIVQMLIDVGLGEVNEYAYLHLDPALPAYLALGQSPERLEELRTAWAEAMTQLVGFLYRQQFKNSLITARLILLDLPNLLALLDWLEARVQTNPATAEAVSETAAKIEELLANQGQPHALARAITVREIATAELPSWGRVSFEHERLHVERLLQRGQLRTAYECAQALLEKVKSANSTEVAGNHCGTSYELAMATNLLGQVLFATGQASPALDQFFESQQLFEVLGEEYGARMASAVLTRQADCLVDLGWLDEAAERYQEVIRRSEGLGYARQAATGKANLANVRRMQGRYADALVAYTEVRAFFEMQNEPATIAAMWNQIGMVHQATGEFDVAEVAHRQALEIHVQNNLQSGQAVSLEALGDLYSVSLNRLEEAVKFYQQAADIEVTLENPKNEGRDRAKVAAALGKLGRYAEARTEIARAIECYKPFGATVELWKSFNILHQIEAAEGNGEATRTTWGQARDTYLAYRRQGGYPQTTGGELVEHVGDMLAQQKFNEIQALFEQLLNNPQAPEMLKYLVQALMAVLNGARDPSLADNPALYHVDAAEVLWLMERLEQLERIDSDYFTED